MTEISRRALLTGATATAATVGLGSILISPGLISAKVLEAAVDPECDAKCQFNKLSEALTGIDRNLLALNVDPFKFSDEVFARAKDADSVRFQALLDKFKGTVGNPPKSAGDLHNDPDEDTRFLVRSIILAWYLGAWYKPGDLKKFSYKAKDVYYSTRRYSQSVLIPHEVLSPSAYTNSLVWRVAQAHPMGYSNLQFGYWGGNPPKLSMFTKPLPPDDPNQGAK